MVILITVKRRQLPDTDDPNTEGKPEWPAATQQLNGLPARESPTTI
jgi:hypothetical protein